jgi:dTDP-4-dehydrorhamnose reductase
MNDTKPRMLIIGSRGFLGAHITRAAASDFEVMEGNRPAPGQSAEVTIDIKDERSVKQAFAASHPVVVLLLSAYSDIDYCQKHPDEARAVNLRGAEYVAAECARSNAHLLFTSTGAVFDGKKHGYTETDPVSPVSVYGETKAAAETSISKLLPNAILARISLVVGFAGRSGTNSLLDNLKRRWVSGQSVAMPVFEYRNPIDAGTCSQFMLDLVKRKERGVFNIGCTDSLSRYDLGLKFASRMGYSDCVESQLDLPPGRAPRGPDHFLLTEKLRGVSNIPIPSCDQVVERCFDVAA